VRPLLVLGCAVALLAPLGRAAPDAQATSLTITYVASTARPDERVRWTLRCDPPAGTHPRRLVACHELTGAGWRAFAPLPTGVACADIHGGPQLGIVAGRVDGRRVWARLTRPDGCQIERWGRLPSLLPKGAR
jgi:subtilisin inhibitor-like